MSAAVLALIRLGWRQARSEPATLAATAALYVLILAIFASIWRATPLGELARTDHEATRLLWYVAITEWILFAPRYPYREVEADALGGHLDAALIRPIPHAVARLAEWAGVTAFRLLALGAIGGASAFLLTGTCPLALLDVPALALLAVLAATLQLLFQLPLGLAALWMGSSAPVFWIWQKLLFVLGGLLLPITIYPPLLRQIAEASPFAAILYGPASIVFGLDARSIAAIAATQIGWIAVVGAGALVIDRAAERRLVRGDT